LAAACRAAWAVRLLFSSAILGHQWWSLVMPRPRAENRLVIFHNEWSTDFLLKILEGFLFLYSCITPCRIRGPPQCLSIEI
jgi:hypothetical protein